MTERPVFADPKKEKKKKVKPDNKDLYTQVHERDDGRCRVCGDKVEVGSAHHIFGKEYDAPEDLITLGWGNCRCGAHYIYHHVSIMGFIQLVIENYGLKRVAQFIMKGLNDYTIGKYKNR